MLENIFKHLQSKNEGVAEKAAMNYQIANLFMGVVGRLVVEAANKGIALENIRIGNPVCGIGDVIIAKVTISNLLIPSAMPAFLGTRYSEVGDYVSSKSAGLSRACQRNPDFVRFLNSLLGICEQMAKHKGIKFVDLRVSSAILDKEDNLVVKFETGKVARA